MNTVTQRMTAEDLLRMPDDGMRHELVRGKLTTMPPAGGEHGVIGINLSSPLNYHAKAHDQGRVVDSSTGFIIARDPDTVRAADVALVRKERIPAAGISKKFILGAPDVAAEIISPEDRLTVVKKKVLEWLAAGTRLVWVVNPRNHTVTVYASPTDVRILTRNDILDGGDVVPGFQLPVRDIFV